MRKHLLFILILLVGSLGFSFTINSSLIEQPSDIIARDYFLKVSGTYYNDLYLEKEVIGIDGTVRIDFPLITIGIHAFTTFSSTTIDSPEFLDFEGAMALTFGPLYAAVAAPFVLGTDNIYLVGIPSIAFGIAGQKETYRSYNRVDISYIPHNFFTIINGEINMNPDFDPLNAALRINLYSERYQKFGIDVTFKDLKLFLEQQELLYSVKVIFGKTLSFYGVYSNFEIPYKAGAGLDLGILQGWAFVSLNEQFEPEQFELSVVLNF
ncbi:hypothetical protein JYK00_01650 [Thermosipho ferrireducens]|uniref:Uncharacterized protein n=1 Tax=Thermosipho ferrireducens TaxID=2571116 RepID=A0ABX7S6S2_9BACT|nr:hypothetical protein [Thermosipho ferrireducens]QTA38269.1 hypothetical protein JYK00_01650 [Thermosipho ferrireducens]